MIGLQVFKFIFPPFISARKPFIHGRIFKNTRPVLHFLVRIQALGILLKHIEKEISVLRPALTNSRFTA